jgi:hypothetical protein
LTKSGQELELWVPFANSLYSKYGFPLDKKGIRDRCDGTWLKKASGKKLYPAEFEDVERILRHSSNNLPEIQPPQVDCKKTGYCITGLDEFAHFNSSSMALYAFTEAYAELKKRNFTPDEELGVLTGLATSFLGLATSKHPHLTDPNTETEHSKKQIAHAIKYLDIIDQKVKDHLTAYSPEMLATFYQDAARILSVSGFFNPDVESIYRSTEYILKAKSWDSLMTDAQHNEAFPLWQEENKTLLLNNFISLFSIEDEMGEDPKYTAEIRQLREILEFEF